MPYNLSLAVYLKNNSDTGSSTIPAYLTVEAPDLGAVTSVEEDAAFTRLPEDESDPSFQEIRLARASLEGRIASLFQDKAEELAKQLVSQLDRAIDSDLEVRGLNQN